VSHLVKVAHDATQAGADTTYHTTAAYHDIWLLVHLKGHLKRSSRYSPSSNVG
jgi:predicted HD phosphohydrolase